MASLTKFLGAVRSDTRKTSYVQHMQYPPWVYDGSVVSEAFLYNNDRFRHYNEAMAAIEEFSDAVLDLMDEWEDFVDWLSYRHMVSYWIGLIEWRHRVYDRRAFTPPFQAARPRGRLHRVRQMLVARFLLLWHTDDGWYTLEREEFQQVQREQRQGYLARLRELKAQYSRVIGETRVRLAIKRCEARMGGRFEVKKEFDREMEVVGRHLDGDVRFEK